MASLSRKPSSNMFLSKLDQVADRVVDGIKDGLKTPQKFIMSKVGGDIAKSRAISEQALDASFSNMEFIYTPLPDAQKDMALLDGLEQGYFQENFDPLSFEVKKLPLGAILSEDCFEERIRELDRTLDLINLSLSEKIVKSYNAFVQGLSHVESVGDDLMNTLVLCKNGRYRIRKSKEMAEGSLGVLTKYRRRNMMLKVVGFAQKIKQVMRTEQRMNEYMEEGDFPAAIELVVENRALAEKFRVFDACRNLSSTFADAEAQIRRKIDISLMQSCRDFQAQRYEKCVRGYQMLRLGYSVVDTVHKFFSEIVDSLSTDIIRTYILKVPQYHAQIEEITRMPFERMCRLVKSDDLISCQLHLFSVLADQLYNYYKIYEFHMQQAQTSNGVEVTADILSSLDKFRRTLWESVQRRAGSFLSSANYSSFKIDAMLQVFFASNMLCEMGEEFSNSTSEVLQSSLKTQSKFYFDFYHKEVIEMIRTVFRNELWINLGISDFNIKDIPELSAVSSSLSSPTPSSSLPSSSSHAALSSLSSSASMSSISKSASHVGSIAAAAAASANQVTAVAQQMKSARTFIHAAEGSHNPFRKAAANGSFNLEEAQNDSDDDSDYYDSDLDSDEEEERIEARKRKQREKEAKEEAEAEAQAAAAAAQQAAAQQMGGGERVKGYVFSNATLNVAKAMSKYITVMEVLHPIALDVYNGILHLFNFYVFTVFAIFSNTYKETYYPETDATLSNVLRHYFKDLATQLADYDKKHLDVAAPDQASLPGRATKFLSSALEQNQPIYNSIRVSEAINIISPITSFGLRERVVASESLLFITEVLKLIRKRVFAVMPAEKLAGVRDFFTGVPGHINEMRTITYKRMSTLLIKLDAVPKQIEDTKWDIREITEQNAYVNGMIQEFKKFSTHVSGSDPSSVPQSVVDTMWTFAINNAMDTVVEGYSRIRKCSEEGRALMSLDLNTLQTSLERLCTTLRPIPRLEHVSSYIKAFYLSDADAVSWVRQHLDQYTPKQLLGLANYGIGSRVSRKVRSDCVAMIEAFEKGGMPGVHAFLQAGGSGSGFFGAIGGFSLGGGSGASAHPSSHISSSSSSSSSSFASSFVSSSSSSSSLSSASSPSPSASKGFGAASFFKNALGGDKH